MEEHEDFMEKLEKLIANEQYEVVKQIFHDILTKEKSRNLVEQFGLELMQNFSIKHLTESNYKHNQLLFACAEELLKIVASYGPAEAVLLDLLELIEEGTSSKHNFNSVLHALQLILIRLTDRKPQALDWCFNAVLNRVLNLSIPDYLLHGYDLKQEHLLEQDVQVENLLMHHITVNLFYEPLLLDIVTANLENQNVFYNCGLTRRNIMCCFLVQLLGKPLALLDIGRHEESIESHSMKRADKLAKDITKCITNPLFFLYIIEKRAKWQRTNNQYDLTTNVFLCPEKLPMDALAIYIYMVFVEAVSIDNIPQVYDQLYIFEIGLYCVVELLDADEPALQNRGVQLASKLLQNLATKLLLYTSLEVQVYQKFFILLCKIITFSNLNHLRKSTAQLLHQYILQYEDEGRYFVIKNLMHSTGQNSISGYLSTIYKNIVAEKLTFAEDKSLLTVYSGRYFQEIFLDNICKLPNDAETDIIECSDYIIAGLNIIRFFALKDCKNCTGFWNFADFIQTRYLTNLRNGINMTTAHIKAELKAITCADRKFDGLNEIHGKVLKNVHISNGLSPNEMLVMSTTDENKTALLQKNLCTLNLIESLLARAEECLLSNSSGNM